MALGEWVSLSLAVVRHLLVCEKERHARKKDVPDLHDGMMAGVYSEQVRDGS